jgi:2TM domain
MAKESSDIDDIISDPAMSAKERSVRKHVRRMAEFYQHAMTYITVISILWIINIVFDSPNLGWPKNWNTGQWAIWPTVWWGVGLFFHGVWVFGMGLVNRTGILDDDWEERKVQELMNRK